jgi:hypothetical protein
MKYSQASFVIIGFDCDQKKSKIDYSDNGVFSQKLVLKNGLQNAENRIQAVNGILTILKLIGFKAKNCGSKITERTFLLENNQLEFILCLGRLISCG